MGWFGYGLFDGDDTITRYYNFMKWAKVPFDDEDYENDPIVNWIMCNEKMPDFALKIFKKNLKLVLKKMPKLSKAMVNTLSDDFKDDPRDDNCKNYDFEDNAIAWQMLVTIIVDNNIKVPKKIIKNGILATQYLMKFQAIEFDFPSKRKRVLKSFITKLENHGH